MNTITVHASRTYDVLLGPGVLRSLGERAAALVSGRTACLVSDSLVYSFHGARTEALLRSAGFTVCAYVFPQGEQSKNGATFLELCGFLAQKGLTRSDLVVALGGGVTGDLAGFAAACYLRGVPCIQVPTSLLAMVDSSVGGKTAIDLPQGKNLCGAFSQPRLVLCDTELLETLPEHVFRAGCGEVLKYGILGGDPLYHTLQQGSFRGDPLAVITACVEQKRRLVEADEQDQGQRQLLNLGHTFGHALEAASDYTLPHGEAVAAGLAMITRAAARLHFCTPALAREVEALLEAYGLPTRSDFPPAVLARRALGDKKRRGDTITLVVPREIGRCTLEAVAVEALGTWAEAGRPF